tara:strand:+ start:3972 stop:4217 length:246 start_codon:yes stop_codon:yes gene_type:complete
MLENLMNGLVDTEKITYDTIQTSLQEISIELKTDPKNFFVMIKPTDEDYNFKFYVYKINGNSAPVFVREISLKEILGKETD